MRISLQPIAFDGWIIAARSCSGRHRWFVPLTKTIIRSNMGHHQAKQRYCRSINDRLEARYVRASQPA
jgi:hypothetical protein